MDEKKPTEKQLSNRYNSPLVDGEYKRHTVRMGHTELYR